VIFPVWRTLYFPREERGETKTMLNFDQKIISFKIKKIDSSLVKDGNAKKLD
jgi:hypothetical protein